MALTLQTIINSIETPFRLKLLAGKEGLKKTVSWIYYTEDASTIEFIRGGELAVTLGINYERQKNNLHISGSDHLHNFLQDFIDAFLDKGGSGLIVNTGKYINEIPESIINYCEEKGFPLFTMPWEIHTIDLMQEVGNMISNDNQNSNSIEKFFFKAIFDRENFEPNQIENTPFFNAKLFSIVLMDFDEKILSSDAGKITRYIQFSFNPKLNLPQNSYCSFIHKLKIVYIVRDSNAEFLRRILQVSTADKFFKDSLISVSDYSESLDDFPEIYRHANIALQINSAPGRINYYENLGIYKILMGVKNKNILRKFYDEKLGKLDKIEGEKREDFIKTLSLFLKTGGNILRVAEINNAHRNTVLYRLKRLEELLGIDLSDGETRTALQVALYIRNVLSQFEIQ